MICASESRWHQKFPRWHGIHGALSCEGDATFRLGIRTEHNWALNAPSPRPVIAACGAVWSTWPMKGKLLCLSHSSVFSVLLFAAETEMNVRVLARVNNRSEPWIGMDSKLPWRGGVSRQMNIVSLDSSFQDIVPINDLQLMWKDKHRLSLSATLQFLDKVANPRVTVSFH